MNRKNYSEAVKKNISSTQVLKTLLKLMEDEYTMSELIQELNKDEGRPVFNNSIISKYITTCKFCGIDIQKIHNRYVISNIPFGMDLSDREYELIQLLQAASNASLPIKTNQKFRKFITKLSKYSNKTIKKIDDDTIDFAEAMFKKAASEGKKVRLMFKMNSTIECCPIGIIEENGKKYFHVWHNNKERKILSERLSYIEITKEKFGIIKSNEDIVYKLTGGLASRYQIRPHEKIIDNHLPEYIVISNMGETPEMLLPRLLRYDSLCEVKKPNIVRAEMKKIVDRTLANYGE